MNKDELVKNIILSLSDTYERDKNDWKPVKTIFDRCWNFKLELDINNDNKMDGDITAYFDFKSSTYDLDSAKLKISFKGMSEAIWVYGYNWNKTSDKNAFNLLKEIYHDKLKTTIDNLRNSSTDESILNKVYQSVGKKKRRNDTIDSILEDVKKSKGSGNKNLSDKIDKVLEIVNEEKEKEVPKKKGFFSKLFGS